MEEAFKALLKAGTVKNCFIREKLSDAKLVEVLFHK
jgi:hypothetical protein